MVLGNAPLTESERALLTTLAEQPRSVIFTTNAGFNSPIADGPWHRRVAVIQDYVFQALDATTQERLTSPQSQFGTTVVVESDFEGVLPATYGHIGTQLLSKVAQRRLLNRTARGRHFRLSHEYLPSTGVIALALALQEMKSPSEPVALIGFGLSHSELYEARPETRDPSIFMYLHDFVPCQRQHFRPDAMAVAAFSFHYNILPTRPEVAALTRTWTPPTSEIALEQAKRPASTFGALKERIVRGDVKSLIKKIGRQVIHYRIPRTD